MAGAAPQGGQPDNSMGVLWITAAVFLAIGVVWYFFKIYIIGFYFKIKLLEISLISFFTNNLSDVRTFILSATPQQVTLDTVMKVGQAVGYYLRIPCAALIVILAFVVFFANSARSFKSAYSMRQLVEEEKNNWPQIMPIAKLDLVHTDIDKGPWAMALTPMQFCKRNKLLEERRGQPQEGMSRKEWDRVHVTLKRGEANKIFAMQVGPLWKGASKLPPHAKALFVAFAARINEDTKVCADLLARINTSSAKRLNFAGVDEFCKKYEGTKLVQKIIKSHAYVLTIMASMLEAARQDGVQTTADFLWLKPVDRKL